jgi:hypothetical protein
MSLAPLLVLREGDRDRLADLARVPSVPSGSAKVVVATLVNDGRPPRRLGITHWSARFMTTELGISFASVARIWRKWHLQPHRIETFKFSTDPELEAKIRDVVGLYLAPRTTRWWSAGMRSPRSRPWTGPRCRRR